MNLKKGMILLSVLLLFCLSFITVVVGFMFFLDPPIGETTETDPKALGNYNNYVENALLSDFKGSLPTAGAPGRNDQRYLYWYGCSVFGDPQFCVNLTSRFEDATAFNTEWARIEELSVCFEEISDKEKIYFINGTSENISKLLDDEIFDGTPYQFEIVIVNSELQSMEYFSAFLWEGQTRTPFIEEFFNKV